MIDPKAILGNNNYIGPYCFLDKGAVLGDNNRLEAFVSISTPPEHKSYHTSPLCPGTHIGHFNVFKEFVTVNRGTKQETRIGNNCWFLTKSHVGHDAYIDDDATISCAVLIGGHGFVGKAANLGLGAVIHQRLAIGAYAMVGMNSTVTKHVPPFATVFGSPAKFKHINERGLKKNGFEDSETAVAADWVRAFYENEKAPEFFDGNLNHSTSRFLTYIQRLKT